MVFSLEGVLSLERPIGGGRTISLWGGAGSLLAVEEIRFSSGGEVAVELRQYGPGRSHSGLNVGAYVGVGAMDHMDDGASMAITPGVKLTASLETWSNSVLVEPYLGVSYPLMRQLDDAEWSFPETPYLTIGLRIVLRRLRKLPH